MAVGKGIGGGFPLGALSRHRARGQGHDRRHARLDLWRQSAGHGGRAMRCWISCSRRASSTTCAFSPARCSSIWRMLQAEHPDVVAEVRGRGLMLGLKLHVPAADVHRAAAREPADRWSAPARTSCAFCRRSTWRSATSARRSTASARPAPASSRRGRPYECVARGSDAQTCGSTPRHFLDLCDFEPGTLKALIAAARQRKKARDGFSARRRGQGCAADGQDAGADLREAFDAHAHFASTSACGAGRHAASC